VGGHDVDARVTFVGKPAGRLRGLRLTAGADKAYWSELSTGETVRSTLFTQREDTTVNMQFVTDAGTVSWQGPRFPSGTGYRIAIRVDADGGVSEEHCLLPCPLW
jgi:hypothetical protein